MPYCTLDDLKSEGIGTDQASEKRLADLIAWASQEIDNWTGQWFEPRTRRFRLDGTGIEELPLPVKPITITAVSVDGYPFTGPYEVEADPDDPHLYSEWGWPEGHGNVVVEGTFGCVDENGQTPAAIRRVCMRLVARELPKLSDEEGQEQKKRARIIQESTGGGAHAYMLSPDRRPANMSGDPEIDAVLAHYRAPVRGGVA